MADAPLAVGVLLLWLSPERVAFAQVLEGNTQLYVAMASLITAHDLALIAGFLPVPLLSVPAEGVQLQTDYTLKTMAPVLRPTACSPAGHVRVVWAGGAAL